MAHELHLDITNYGQGTYDPVAGRLHLREAGEFTVEIREYKMEMAEIRRQRAVPGQSDAAKAILVTKEKEVRVRYAGVRWIYKETGVFPHLDLKSFSEDIPKGTLSPKINFPKVLAGSGGRAYLEAYFHDPIKEEKTGKMVQCYPKGAAPFGCFISAGGNQEILGAQWKDAKGHNIGDKKVAYGSTVYLYIYTQGLYGADLNILLHDRHGVEADFTIDGKGVDYSKAEDKKRSNKIFTRRVGKVYFDNYAQPQFPAPGGTVRGRLGKSGNGVPAKLNCIQTCVVKVFVDYRWKTEGAGFGLDDGSTLEIYPKVHPAGIGGETTFLKNCVLTVSQNGATYNDMELKGNSPVLIDTKEVGPPKDRRKRIDFTFGVFIDGTLNNMYNTEAREAFEKRTGKVAHTKEDVHRYDKNEKKYRYRDIEDSSYENGLSNPAILFKSYMEDRTSPTHKRYRIYTGGIGTRTKPDENGKLGEKQYRNDQKIGYTFGTDIPILSNTGIRDKVRDTVESIYKYIYDNINKIDHTAGTITIDIFGFSRGAAAACHFVDDIKAMPYVPSGGGPFVYDRQHYLMNPKHAGAFLPAGGYLGLLLKEAGKSCDNIVIRFAGLYDTVPHHGFFQDDDIKELRLESINKAKYVVHLVADDEYRANFSLVDISGIIGHKGGGANSKGVELYLPGVHCDVGGGYVEGRSETVVRIDASFDYGEISAVRKALIKHGWFLPDEIKIYGKNEHVMTDQDHDSGIIKQILNATRDYLSIQYSYIPLGIMLKFCIDKSLPMDSEFINKSYAFRNIDDIKNSVAFLNHIKGILYVYAFSGGKKFVYEEPHGDNPDAFSKNEKRNKALKFLRNNYLHWNAIYGDSISYTLTQPYRPKKENGKPKRDIK